MKWLVSSTAVLFLLACAVEPAWAQRGGGGGRSSGGGRPSGSRPPVNFYPGGGAPQTSSNSRGRNSGVRPNYRPSIDYPQYGGSGSYDPGVPDDDVSYSRGGSDDDTRAFNRRFLRVKNNTDETLTVYVQYRTTTEGDQWSWFPANPARSAKALEFELEPGESAALGDGDWKINASRVRIWAKGEGREWMQYRNKDLWLVTETDDDGQRVYYSPRMGTFTFTFN